MSNKLWLLTVVGRATLILALGYGALPMVDLIPGVGQSAKGVLGLFAAAVTTAIAAWWMFGKLRTRYTKREAKTATITIAVFGPISCAVSSLLALLPVVIADSIGLPFGEVGVYAGFLLMFILTNFLAISLVILIKSK